MIFDRVVAPLARDTEKVALFMIDAFRFEMGKDLEAEIKGAGITVEMSARLAELPTITSVGMNVLAPVTTDEKVFPVLTDSGFSGFRMGEQGEYVVNDPKSRVRAIGQKSRGPAVPLLKLADVRTMSTAQLQKVVKEAPSVLVVHSLEPRRRRREGLWPGDVRDDAPAHPRGVDAPEPGRSEVLRLHGRPRLLAARQDGGRKEVRKAQRP